MSVTKAAVAAAAEKLGWSVRFDTQKSWSTGREEKYAEFEGCSPAGEDLIFTEFYHSLSDLPSLLYERYTDFDAEQHAMENYGAKGAPDSLRVLLDDADAIEGMILDLSESLPS